MRASACLASAQVRRWPRFFLVRYPRVHLGTKAINRWTHERKDVQDKDPRNPISAKPTSLEENLPPQYPINPDLAPHIRMQGDITITDTGFHVCFLGTGSGQTALFRSNSATCLRMGSTVYLFDAGEGVQRQLMLSTISVGDIKKIFSKCLPKRHRF